MLALAVIQQIVKCSEQPLLHSFHHDSSRPSSDAKQLAWVISCCGFKESQNPIEEGDQIKILSILDDFLQLKGQFLCGVNSTY